jgi:hypothetical protein
MVTSNLSAATAWELIANPRHEVDQARSASPGQLVGGSPRREGKALLIEDQHQPSRFDRRVQANG